MTMTSGDNTQAILWENDHLRLLDQRLLPQEVVYLDITDIKTAADAIRDIRGGQQRVQSAKRYAGQDAAVGVGTAVSTAGPETASGQRGRSRHIC